MVIVESRGSWLSWTREGEGLGWCCYSDSMESAVITLVDIVDFVGFHLLVTLSVNR